MTSAEPRLSRRKLLSGSLAAGLAATGFIGWQAAFAGVYETQIGEQRDVLLSDGTRLRLDTDTKLRVTSSGSMQRIALSRGRFACWPVSHEGASLVVEAGDMTILPKSQSFDVSYLGGRVTLYCEGGPAVAMPARGGAVSVDPGARLVGNGKGPPSIDRPTAATLTAWRDGQLAFENVPLGEAVQQLNRYSRNVILVDGPVAGLRLSGRYSTGDNMAFARAVALLLPVEVSTGEGRIRISAQNPNEEG